MTYRDVHARIVQLLERTGRTAVRGVEEVGYCGVLVGESLFWLVYGPFLKQPVRLAAVVGQMMEVGIRAIPIIAVLSAAIGAVLAMQGIISLKPLGAESRVIFGILVAPALFAMLVMVPALTIFSGLMGVLAGGLYVGIDLSISMNAYIADILDALNVGDVLHGFSKSIAFGVLIAVIGVMNGARVEGGAEGVGKATTRAVVQAISAIIITDMLFVLVSSLTR
jgi:phospholipid/cholesterol/gamma-HCH transport system permease protein